MTRAESMPVVLPLRALGRNHLARVGGKAANLGEMLRAGLPVPPGFCVTTAAFESVMRLVPEVDDWTRALEELGEDDGAAAEALGARLRAHLEQAPLPPGLEDEILAAWRDLGEAQAVAVRSSATAEDLPGASFAGQHDTFLNVRGAEALMKGVRACWASLFSERALAYRLTQGFGHRQVALAVVVQRMLTPEVSGILFTADPIDGRRHVTSIDAGFGLGEALVSGVVSADLYKLDRRTGQILERRVADKQLAIRTRPDGGTETVALPASERRTPALEDQQVRLLAALGELAAGHLGGPQDVEWCLVGGEPYLVQSRPITTLFPVPPAHPLDPGLRVLLSLGHLQVMTDAMRPFAHSMLRRLLPLGPREHGEARWVRSAGGRLFADVSAPLATPGLGALVLRFLDIVDTRMAGAAGEVAGRRAFRSATRGLGAWSLVEALLVLVGILLPSLLWALLGTDLETLEARVRAWMDQDLAATRRRVASAPTPLARLEEAAAVVGGLLPRVALRLLPRVAAGTLAGLLLRALLGRRVDPGTFEALDRGLEGNVTTRMNLAIGDLADTARATRALAEALRAHPDLDLATLAEREGSARFLDQLETFLEEYGARGTSEIDVTRPRWRDDPRALLQVIRGGLDAPVPGAHRAHHARLQEAGRAAVERLTAAAPWGTRFLVRRLARAVRHLFALREHPKFQIIRHLALARAAALEVGAALAARGRLRDPEDAWFLEYRELCAAARAGEGEGEDDPCDLVPERREALERQRRLTPPRVLTSEGERVTPPDLGPPPPPGTLRGTPASAGVVEGVARVILDPKREAVAAGEVLVAPFTDPGWTPLFLNAAGLVMEVGGMMTHGSVVAREYGIPAVVCVEGATTRIRTGQRVRVDGTRGLVELLEGPGPPP